jgi:hypothetical protein
MQAARSVLVEPVAQTKVKPSEPLSRLFKNLPTSRPLVRSLTLR